MLAEVADAHPGETVLVVLDADTLDPGTVVELAVDADDWVCVAWG